MAEVRLGGAHIPEINGMPHDDRTAIARGGLRPSTARTSLSVAAVRHRHGRVSKSVFATRRKRLWGHHPAAQRAQVPTPSSAVRGLWSVA